MIDKKHIFPFSILALSFIFLFLVTYNYFSLFLTSYNYEVLIISNSESCTACLLFHYRLTPLFLMVDNNIKYIHFQKLYPYDAFFATGNL